MDQSIQKDHLRLLAEGKKIAFIQAGWHSQIVRQAYEAFVEDCSQSGIAASQIDVFEVSGSLEIPLQAKLLAKSQKYAVVVAAGLIVDGGIYRHDFVASSVLDAMMRIQLESEVPILSVVLTPHNFQETDAHKSFFFEHFKLKGREAAQACVQTLRNLEAIASAV
jgi:6,7-dimethyl-8-ribityllumazine synthase